jgi:hypothetical protein
MKKIILSVLLLGLLALTFAIAFADQPSESRVTTLVADSNFAEDTCVSTGIGVHVDDGWRGIGSGRTSLDSASVHYVRYDHCTGETLLMADGIVPINGQTFRLMADLASAVLNTTIPVKDILSANTFSLTVSLTWTANGPQQQLRENQHGSFDGVIYNYVFSSIIQPTDVSGRISLDGKDLIAGQPLTGSISEEASLNVTIS